MNTCYTSAIPVFELAGTCALAIYFFASIANTPRVCDSGRVPFNPLGLCPTARYPALVKWHGAEGEGDFLIDRFDVRGELDWIDPYNGKYIQWGATFLMLYWIDRTPVNGSFSKVEMIMDSTRVLPPAPTSLQYYGFATCFSWGTPGTTCAGEKTHLKFTCCMQAILNKRDCTVTCNGLWFLGANWTLIHDLGVNWTLIHDLGVTLRIR